MCVAGALLSLVSCSQQKSVDFPMTWTARAPIDHFYAFRMNSLGNTEVQTDTGWKPAFWAEGNTNYFTKAKTIVITGSDNSGPWQIDEDENGALTLKGVPVDGPSFF